jgi:hypothetical protein
MTAVLDEVNIACARPRPFNFKVQSTDGYVILTCESSGVHISVLHGTSNLTKFGEASIPPPSQGVMMLQLRVQGNRKGFPLFSS